MAGLPILCLSVRRQTGRYFCLRATDWRMSRLSSGVRVLWPSDGLGPGVRWCDVFQVVKTAQSRGRTERTLLTALSQLQCRDKSREVWSRHAGTSNRPVASVCINCETAYAVISALRRRALARRRNAAERLNPSLLITLPFLLNPSHHADER
jgi:hypothetical protein